MASMNDHLTWLQEWYLEQCDGDWEHMYGVTLETLDNPGWSIKIDLAETDLSELVVERVRKHRSEDDWVDYGVREQTFTGACGPLCLNELLGAFRVHAERGE